VRAGAVTLSPARRKVGSTLVAPRPVTTGGSPVKPTGIASTASVGGTKAKGGATSSSGLAAQLLTAPRSGKRTTPGWTICSTTAGQSFTERFALRLG